MARRTYLLMLLGLLALLLAACNYPGASQLPTPFPNDAAVQATQTAIAFIQQLAGSLTPAAGTAAPTTPQPTSSGTDGSTGSISGVVWHDLCASGSEGQPAPGSPPAGCVPGPQGGYAANGTRESGEPGIPDLTVSLGQGACFMADFASATTDGAGAYRFDDLAPGTYCVSVDSFENQEPLIPGSWTFPAGQAGSGYVAVTVEVAAGQQVTGVDFGWDHQFLPVAPTSAPVPTSTSSSGGSSQDCTYRARFVADVNIPDGTEIEAGKRFVKTWRVRNDGTCTWGPDFYDLYAVGFAYGDRMGARKAVELPGVVRPGETVDISVEFTAPTQPGRYESYWQMAFQDGDLLGMGDSRTGYLFVKIRVPGTATQQPADENIKVSFASGATNIAYSDSLNSNRSRGYLIRAGAGQILIANLVADDSDSARLRLYDPGGKQVTPDVTVDGGYLRATLPVTGEYQLVVSSRDSTIQYTLGISIPARIRFERGAYSATVEGQTAERRSVAYVLRALEGQTMYVELDASREAALEIYGLSDGQPLIRHVAGATTFSDTLPATQDYIILVVPGVDAQFDYELYVEVR